MQQVSSIRFLPKPDTRALSYDFLNFSKINPFFQRIKSISSNIASVGKAIAIFCLILYNPDIVFGGSS